MCERGNTKLLEGCKCQLCGKIYQIDLLISDELWELINPKKIRGFKGRSLLCGSCIMNRLEAVLGYDYFYLSKESL